MVQTLKWAIAHLSIRLGARRKGSGRARRGAGRAGWGAGRRRSRGTTRGAQGRARAREEQGRAALLHGRLGGHDTATARAWACLCAPGRAGWAVCVHCALDQFLTQYYF